MYAVRPTAFLPLPSRICHAAAFTSSTTSIRFLRSCVVVVVVVVVVVLFPCLFVCLFVCLLAQTCDFLLSPLCYNLLVVPKLHTPPCAPLDARDFYSKQRGRGLNPTSPFFSFCHVHSCVNQQPNRDTWPHVVHESIQTNTLTLSKPKLRPAQVWPGAGAAPVGVLFLFLCRAAANIHYTTLSD